jgi:GH18 family chitinase
VETGIPARRCGRYGYNPYDFFGTPWAESITHHTNLKAIEQGGWAINTIVELE